MRHKCSTSLICRWSSVLVACALLGVGCDIPFSVVIDIDTPSGILELQTDADSEGDIEGSVELTQMLTNARVQREANNAAPSFVQRVTVRKLKVREIVLILESGDIDGLEVLTVTYIPQQPLSGEPFPDVILGTATADPFGPSRFGNRVPFEVDSSVDFLKLIRENDEINRELGENSGAPRILIHGSGTVPSGDLAYDSTFSVTASGVASLF